MPPLQTNQPTNLTNLQHYFNQLEYQHAKHNLTHIQTITPEPPEVAQNKSSENTTKNK